MKATAVALVALVVATGCGDDDGATGPVGYDVVMVVGAAVADDAADTTGFPGVGSSFSEQWTLDCESSDACTLHRSAGAPLGTLTELALTKEDDGGGLGGEAAGVTAVPDPVEPSPCEGSDAERWTVTVELTRNEDVIVGSVFRVPDSLVDGDCYGLDLTLGFSGTRILGSTAPQ